MIERIKFDDDGYTLEINLNESCNRYELTMIKPDGTGIDVFVSEVDRLEGFFNSIRKLKLDKSKKV